MNYSLSELVTLTDASIEDEHRIAHIYENITGIAPIDRATCTEITYVESSKDIDKIENSQARVIIMSKKDYVLLKRIPKGKIYVVIGSEFLLVKNTIIKYFTPIYNDKFAKIDRHVSKGIIYSGAYVECADCISDGTIVMPGVVIYQGVTIGRDCVIHPNVVIYPGTKIGNNCVIGPGCTLGSPPLVYNTHFGIDGYSKANIIGGVRIEDSVELGANVNIDAATIGATVIDTGTKIGAHTHIAHDCYIGKHNYIVTQVGIAGWCETGDNCYLAGQVGLAPKVKLGNNVTVDAKSGVHNDLPDNAHVFGTPAVEKKQANRTFAALKYLPNILRRLRALEKRVNNGY